MLLSEGIPFKPVLILKHATRTSTEETSVRTEWLKHIAIQIGTGPNTVSESTVSDTELSESFGPHRVPGREVSEFL